MVVPPRILCVCDRVIDLPMPWFLGMIRKQTRSWISSLA
jgi:hypothetical protein